MDSKSKMMEVALKLAEQMPLDKINYADIADAAGVHWTTVRRHLGSKERMRTHIAEWMRDRGKEPAHGDTRSKIIEAARTVFARLGYSGASLDQVAAEAGMTKGAVYWHFASKQDLYVALLESNMSAQKRLIPQQAQAVLEADDPVRALSSWLRGQCASCLENPDAALLFLEFLVSSREPGIRSKLAGLFEELHHQVALMLAELQCSGRLWGEPDAKAISVYIQSVMHGMLVTSVIHREEIKLDVMMDDVASMLWNGLYPRPAEEPRGE
ncbi:TetR/AcrR family transcriptional regulator [Paenibacillus campinasensis]|nr:TetR/AcrR family transcriptional regulator [Paenibacillus campinasensis]